MVLGGFRSFHVLVTTFPLTRFWLRTLTHVDLNHVNRIEERQKGLSFNEKLSAVQLLHFSSDLS